MTFGKPLVYRNVRHRRRHTVFKMGQAMSGDENVLDVTTLNLADHRLKNLICDRRARRAAICLRDFRVP
jgi:hypothetical protein